MGMTPIVKRLLIANVAITFIVLIMRQLQPSVAVLFEHYFELTPSLVMRGYVWQLFTYMFLHIDPGHLLFNMLGLWLLGVMLEQQWGSRSFLKFMVLSGLGAGACVVAAGLAFHPMNRPTLGISGALNALLMACALMYPNQQVFYGFLPVKGKQLLYGVIVLDLLFALAGSASSLPAHFGGLAMGYLLVTGNWRPSRVWQRLSGLRRPRRSSHLKVVRPRASDDDDDELPKGRYLN